MNSRREIERVLETWFVDGPTVMPDRVFDAVFDRVERTPQRRLARLHMRLTEMTPRIRLIAAAAAAVIVAVVGYSLIGRGPEPNIGASPSPSVASTTPIAVPVELQARWNGGPRDVPGILAGAGTTILFDGTSFEFAQSNAVDRPLVRAPASAAGANQIEIRPASGGPCVAGIYGWQLSPAGRTLTLTAEGGDCTADEIFLEGVWYLEDCPIEDDGCYGELEGGTYSSQYFDPFRPEDGSWQPRFGAFAFTVPAGWSNTADWPLSFNIEPPGGTGDSGIFLYSDIVAAAEDDPCGESRATDVGETASEIASWIGAIPGVVATPATQLQVGDLDAWRIDLSLDPSWSTACEFSEGEPYHGLLVDRPAASGFAWGLRGDGRMRLYLVDLGDGRALMISVEARTKATYDAFVDAATTIVESFQFTR